MRLFVTLSIAVLCLASLAAGQGLFDTIRNFFRPQARPAAPAQQQQAFQPAPQQQQINLNEDADNEGQRFVRQNGAFRQQGNRFRNQNQGFRQNNLGVRAQGNVRNRFQGNTRTKAAGFSAQQQQQTTSCPIPFEDPNDRESPRCPPLQRFETYDGKGIVYTWMGNCTKFTATQADNYCKSLGGRAASLDSNARAEKFLKAAADFGQRYFWTGGRLNHDCKVVYWPSGKSEGFGTPGTRYWSPVGGWNNTGIPRPQPDNRNEYRDREEPETCLGVLNNFYADGIKWHDVACHHKKPTICEI